MNLLCEVSLNPGIGIGKLESKLTIVAGSVERGRGRMFSSAAPNPVETEIHADAK